MNSIFVKEKELYDCLIKNLSCLYPVEPCKC